MIRTACDPLPLDTLPLVPAEGRAADVPEGAPLLLPLNCRQAPAPDCEVDPVEVDPEDGARLIAEVLPDDVDEGFTRCHPPVAPVEVPLRTAALLVPVLEPVAALDRVAPVLAAERVIACLC